MKSTFTFLLFCIVLAVCLLFSLPIKKYTNYHYDERQEIIRGKANKYANYTLIIFLAVYFIYDLFFGDKFITLSASVLAFTGILLSVCIFLIYSVWNSAFLQVNQHGTGIFVLYGFIALLNIGVFILNYKNTTFPIENGVLQFTNSLSQLFCGIIFGSVSITYFIKRITDKMEG